MEKSLAYFVNAYRFDRNRHGYDYNYYYNYYNHDLDDHCLCHRIYGCHHYNLMINDKNPIISHSFENEFDLKDENEHLPSIIVTIIVSIFTIITAATKISTIRLIFLLKITVSTS